MSVWDDSDAAYQRWVDEQEERAYYEQRPTVEEYCADAGHGYYGDDGPADDPNASGRCYCGERRYPVGGPTTTASTAIDDEEPF